MIIAFRTLVRSLVKPFYRQLAGIFLFAMIVLFGAVGKLNGQDLLGYHFFLIHGMLSSASFLCLVFFCWLLYARYGCRYIWNKAADPAFQFLFLINTMDKTEKYALLFFLHAFLFLPVIAYATVMVIVACYLHWFVAAAAIMVFLLATVGACCRLTDWRLTHPGHAGLSGSGDFFFRQRPHTGYTGIFLQFIFSSCKALYFSLKLASIGILWFLVRGQQHDATEIKMPLLLYVICVFGHGLILHAWRETETQKMAFLPGLPYPILTRLLQTVISCLILLAPETILLLMWTPGEISLRESALLLGSGFSLLLTIHCLLFLGKMSRTDYLKLTACFFFIFFISVLAGSAGWMSLVLIILSILIFYRSYDRYE